MDIMIGKNYHPRARLIFCTSNKSHIRLDREKKLRQKKKRACSIA